MKSHFYILILLTLFACTSNDRALDEETNDIAGQKPSEVQYDRDSLINDVVHRSRYVNPLCDDYKCAFDQKEESALGENIWIIRVKCPGLNHGIPLGWLTLDEKGRLADITMDPENPVLLITDMDAFHVLESNFEF